MDALLREIDAHMLMAESCRDVGTSGYRHWQTPPNGKVKYVKWLDTQDFLCLVMSTRTPAAQKINCTLKTRKKPCTRFGVF